jgi:hypothetical protein
MTFPNAGSGDEAVLTGPEDPRDARVPLVLRDPDETLTVVLNKAPARGIWFNASGVTVKVEDVRHIGSEELVIFGTRVSAEELPSLNPKKQRRVPTE